MKVVEEEQDISAERPGGIPRGGCASLIGKEVLSNYLPHAFTAYTCSFLGTFPKETCDDRFSNIHDLDQWIRITARGIVPGMDGRSDSRHCGVLRYGRSGSSRYLPQWISVVWVKCLHFN